MVARGAYLLLKTYIWGQCGKAAKLFTIKIMNGTDLNSIKTGQKVRIVLKADQGTGKLTEGVVKDILTKSPVHPHGIKVGWKMAW